MPLNNFLDKYKPNLFDDVYNSILNKLFKSLEIINDYSDVEATHKLQYSLIKQLFELKKEIDNIKWDGGVPPKDTLIHQNFPDFTDTEIKLFENTNNFYDFKEYY